MENIAKTGRLGSRVKLALPTKAKGIPSIVFWWLWFQHRKGPQDILLVPQLPEMLHIPEKWSLWEDLPKMCKLLIEMTEEEKDMLFSVVPSNRTRGNGPRSEHIKIHLDWRKYFVTVRVAEHWHRLPRRLRSLHLCRHSKAGWPVCSTEPCLSRRVGPGDLQSSLLTSALLWDWHCSRYAGMTGASSMLFCYSFVNLKHLHRFYWPTWVQGHVFSSCKSI